MTPNGVRLIPTLYKRGSKAGRNGQVVRSKNTPGKTKGGRSVNLPPRICASVLCCGRLLFRWQQDPDAAGRNLAIPVHPEIVSHFRAWNQRRCITLMQPRDVEEDVFPPAIRAQESKALFFEVRHHGTR